MGSGNAKTVRIGPCAGNRRCHGVFRRRGRRGRRLAGRLDAEHGAPDNGPPPLGTPGRGYALGGAHVLGIPYDEYIKRTGADWFPGLNRQIVDYPAGQVQGHTLERLFPGIGKLDDGFPGLGIDGPSIGESVDEGAPNTIDAIREGGPGTVIGLSEGAMVLNDVQAKLANDPNAPPPRPTELRDVRRPGRQARLRRELPDPDVPVGSVVPSLDYRIPAPVESQYDTYQFVSAYDSIADWPDRPDNWMSLAQRGCRSRDRPHRGGVHQPEHGACEEHQDDRQLQGREDDDVT